MEGARLGGKKKRIYFVVGIFVEFVVILNKLMVNLL